MTTNEEFLLQEIELASPAKLRWLLIRKAHGLCQMVDAFLEKKEKLQANNWLLLVQDILGELLAGVTDARNPNAKTIADLYVFLIQQTRKVFETADRKVLADITDILGIELTTWELFVQNENRQSAIQAPIHPPYFASSFGLEASTSLNLEA